MCKMLMVIIRMSHPILAWQVKKIEKKVKEDFYFSDVHTYKTSIKYNSDST